MNVPARSPLSPVRFRRLLLGLLAACLIFALPVPSAPAAESRSANAATDASTGDSRAKAPKVRTLWGKKPRARYRQVKDRRRAELGTVFRAKVDGRVLGVRFFKTAKNKGRHTGTLWDASGVKLATATFTKKSARGWQRVRFDRPVPVKAGKRYVVSYHAPRGRFARSTGFTGRSRTKALHVKRGRSGVISRGPRGTFPQRSHRRSQYWVDVLFRPRRKQAEQTGPERARGVFPTRRSVGLPAGWQPDRRVTGDLWVRKAGAVIEDVRVTGGTIYVDAPNVTLRRVHAVDTRVVNDYRNTCRNGLLIEDSEFTASGDHGYEAVGPGGYTIRRSLLDGVPEGLRVGGRSVGCGPVRVADTFIRVTPPNVCGDWHGDGIQGYDGHRLTVRRTTIMMEETDGCYGTAPFFYPSGQGNTSVDIDGLLVSGGGYSFRNGMPGSVRNLMVVDDWGYGPVDVNCSVVDVWQAHVATLDAAGQPVPVRPIGCVGDGW